MVHPEELRGSKEGRIRQNIRAINLGISQISTGEELLAMAGDGEVVELKNNDHYYIDRGISLKPWKKIKWIRDKKIVEICNPKTNTIFVYPWVKEYADKLAADHFLSFKKRKNLK